MSSPEEVIRTARSPYRLIIWFARWGDIVGGLMFTLLLAGSVAFLLFGPMLSATITGLVALLTVVSVRLLTELLRLLVDTLIPQ